MTTSPRPPKRSGLVSRPSPTFVPDNVSGKDMSAAAARMPSLDFSRPRQVDGQAANTEPLAPPSITVPGLTQEVPTSAEVIIKIRLELLVDSKYQPRLKYDEAKLAELAETLKVRQIDALTVRPLPDGKFEVISGHRRKRAAPLAGLVELECRVITCSDEEARLLVLAANEPHEEFADFERALAYQGILSDKSGSVRTHKQLGDKIGVSQQIVQRRLSMLKLPPVVLGVLREHPAAFSSHWAGKLADLTAKPFDEEKLKAELLRVATGQIQMSAVFSVMAGAAKTTAANDAPRQGLSLQRGNRLFAQVTPNPDKRQVMVKLPGDCDVDEVAKLILSAIDQRFAQSAP